MNKLNTGETEHYYMWSESQNDFINVTKAMYDEEVTIPDLINQKVMATPRNEGDGITTWWWDIAFGMASGSKLNKSMNFVTRCEQSTVQWPS